MDYKDALACAIVPLVLYCLPLCFYRYLIRGYSLSKKHAIITVLIYGFVFALVFSLIMSAITGITVTPASTSFTAFYGLVSYFLLTRGGSHKPTGNDSKTPVNPVEAKNDISASVVADAERAEECPQAPRSGGRYGVPCVQVGVVDALFRVAVAAQNIPGDVPEKAAVFSGSFMDGLLVPLPVQVQNLFVLHCRPPLFALLL